MKTFYVSRLIRGNELYPTRITVSDLGVSIQEPGFFSGRDILISFRHISSVMIDTPFIGYSTIQIQTTGQDSYTIFGFLSSEVKEMREMIMSYINY
jgi:hypothetical protein